MRSDLCLGRRTPVRRCARLFEFREPKTNVEIVGPIHLSRPKKIPKKIQKTYGSASELRIQAQPLKRLPTMTWQADPMTSMTSFRQSLCNSTKPLLFSYRFPESTFLVIPVISPGQHVGRIRQYDDDQPR